MRHMSAAQHLSTDCVGVLPCFIDALGGAVAAADRASRQQQLAGLPQNLERKQRGGRLRRNPGQRYYKAPIGMTCPKGDTIRDVDTCKNACNDGTGVTCAGFQEIEKQMPHGCLHGMHPQPPPSIPCTAALLPALYG